MNPKAIQAALDGRRFTLCTFEHPAALHEVRAWELAMRDCGQLVGEPLHLALHLTTGYQLLRKDGGQELLYAIGIEEGRPDGELRSTLAALTQMLIERTKLPRPWYKALHFGRIPTDDRLNVLMGHWMAVVQRPSPCGHPVCRATHACIAPDTGSGGA